MPVTSAKRSGIFPHVIGPLTFSNIYKILNIVAPCVDCFHVLDHASATFQPKIKEAIHLNQQLHHVNLKSSL